MIAANVLHGPTSRASSCAVPLAGIREKSHNAGALSGAPGYAAVSVVSGAEEAPRASSEQPPHIFQELTWGSV